MVDINASVNDVDINTLATTMLIFILGEGAEGEPWAVANTRETLKKRLRGYESYSWRNEHIADLPRGQISEHLGS